MGKFGYLPAVIALVVVEILIIIISTINCVYKQQRIHDDINLTFKNVLTRLVYNEQLGSFCRNHIEGTKWDYVLLTTRLISLTFFLSVPCIWSYILERGYSYYFSLSGILIWVVSSFCVPLYLHLSNWFHQINPTTKYQTTNNQIQPSLRISTGQLL